MREAKLNCDCCREGLELLGAHIDRQRPKGRFWPVSNPGQPSLSFDTWRTRREHLRYLQPPALEQRKTGRVESSTQTERYLGHPGKASNCRRTRDLALFDLAIDSKPRACDLTKLRVREVAHGEHVSPRAILMQQKTLRPVQFEITEQTRFAIATWIHQAQLRSEDCLFPSQLHTSVHLSTRQYARIVKGWVEAVGLDPAMYGTHTMRRRKASLIYRRTKNLRAVQLLLGHTKLESTVRYLGIEVDDALEMAEQTEV